MHRASMSLTALLLAGMIACGGSGNKGQKEKQPAPVPATGVPVKPEGHVLSEFTYPADAKAAYGYEIADYFSLHPERFKKRNLINKKLLLDRHLELGLRHSVNPAEPETYIASRIPCDGIRRNR